MPADMVYRVIDSEAATKTEDGKAFKKGDFFYTPSDDPSTWKLRKTSTPGGAPDKGHVGAAAAALGKGFRGQKVQIPAKDRASVKAKVRSAWKKLHSDKSEEDMPDGIKAEAIVEAIRAREELRTWVLEGMGLEVPDLEVEHPNRTPFSGVLTRVDEASDKSPGGAQGHKVFIPRAVAEAALPTLLLMGVNVSLDGRGHDRQHKIGVITDAWISGNDVCVEGYLYARDFPEDVKKLKQLSSLDSLGMSYEIADVVVSDVDQPIWEVQHLVFTGAAILNRANAAYWNTHLIAAESEDMEEEPMAENQEATALAAGSGLSASTTVVTAGMDEPLKMMMKMMDSMGVLTSMVDDMQYMKGMMEGLCKAMEGLSAGISTGMYSSEEKKEDGEEKQTMAAEDEKQSAEEAITVAKLAEVVDGLVKQVAAMGELLTDREDTTRDLVTDQEDNRGGTLKTDSSSRVADGGPKRQTMAAGTEYEDEKARQEDEEKGSGRYVGKFQAGNSGATTDGYPIELVEAGFTPGKQYKIDEVDAHLRESGITDMVARTDLKNRLVVTGQLA